MKHIKKRVSICALLFAALMLASCSLFGEDAFDDEPADEPIVLNPAQRTEDTGRVIVEGDIDENYETDEGDVYVIGEKFFVEQCNEVYYNFTEYLGKTIQYEGIFMPEWDNYFSEEIYYVYRYGPGCCGVDSNAGFEVSFSGEYPAPNAWVRATGVLVHYEQNGFYFVRLELSELTVLEQRGAETVAANPAYGGNAHQG